MTLNYRSRKYLEMSPAERREYDLKMCKRPPTTELQRLAQKENFALFQLASMKTNLNHLTACPGISKDKIAKLMHAILDVKRNIKWNQDLRKEAKEQV